MAQTDYPSQYSRIISQAHSINSQIRQLDHIRQQRQRKYQTSLIQFKSYITKQNKLLQRNKQHCKDRDKWFREQVRRCWNNATVNRRLVLRSIARTNVLKRDVNQWLGRVEEGIRQEESGMGESKAEGRESLQGSQLIQKYNDILREFGHRL